MIITRKLFTRELCRVAVLLFERVCAQHHPSSLSPSGNGCRNQTASALQQKLIGECWCPHTLLWTTGIHTLVSHTVSTVVMFFSHCHCCHHIFLVVTVFCLFVVFNCFLLLLLHLFSFFLFQFSSMIVSFFHF
jgi:hypothetical protein